MWQILRKDWYYELVVEEISWEETLICVQQWGILDGMDVSFPIKGKKLGMRTKKEGKKSMH